MKKITLATLCCSLALTLSGCIFIFEGEDNQGRCPPGTYAVSTGFGGYTCESSSVPGGEGWYCANDTDCAAGCYCDSYSSTCAEAGYCSQDADCGYGYTCDESRSSCVPDGTTFPDGGGYYCDPTNLDSCPDGQMCDWVTYTCVPSCTSNDECAAGCYCTEGNCAESCYCATDADAEAAGYGYCDEPRSTCMPGTDPTAPTCNAPVLCALPPPSCPAGEVPLLLDGCYTGECQAVALCDVAPPCAVLNTEADCQAASMTMMCAAVYNGVGCTTPDGTSCTENQANCTCQSYVFASCQSTY